MLTEWAVVIGLAMTPAVVLGPSAACAAGIGFHWSPWVLLPAIAVAGFVEGLLVVCLAAAARRSARVRSVLERFRSKRGVAWANRWGPWVGLLVGPAFVGQEPIVIALAWHDVPARKQIAPLALCNVLYTVIYYVIVRFGWDEIMRLAS